MNVLRDVSKLIGEVELRKQPVVIRV